MLWNLLAIGVCVYAGLCLVFLLFQRLSAKGDGRPSLWAFLPLG
jgi:hypothetical protein